MSLHLPLPTLALATVGVLLLYAIYVLRITSSSPESRFWAQQECVGQQQDRWFASFFARLHSLTGTRALIHEGYARLSKRGKTFTLPQFADHPLLILPTNKIKDLVAKPDDEINLLMVLREALATEYTGDNDLAVDPFHLDVVRHQLTRKLPLMTKTVHDELVLGFTDQWRLRDDEEWVSVPALKTCMNIISRAANRVFSGEQLCRNQEFLDHVREYGNGVFRNAAIINLLPRWLRPVLGPLITLRNQRHVRACQAIARPIISERIERMRSGSKEDANTDALQWVIEEAFKRADPLELDPDRLCRRLVRLNMVAIHTTSITITNTLLDLYSSPRCTESIAGLRDEVSRTLAAHNGEWTKTVVNDLVRIDSTIKESIRCSSLGIVGLTRMVTSPTGIDLGDGIHVPKGIRVAAPIAGIHRDPENYEHPDEYDAFRFSREREVLGGNGRILDKRAQGIVTTSDAFLTFGHGRHACPGRFFAAQEMKLMLAHIVLNYDAKIEGSRQSNFDFRGACVPSPKARLWVRRRQ
ncbi:putative P450 monooxygenase [Teratosphaeria nubilosa]|uniref:Putative P450 monooxygenase n=1 Tax=Teratosphaeria nubilosa TaxID=161662 RepID=A0A6G1L9G8_9PEZI|nr:putative P450 monooxygenase [Teratosphaeria nubilosa]